MTEKQENLFTIGEFAAKAGVTLRTIRYYDRIGLLKPSAHNDLGHRLYSIQDFARLQKILTLKFIGLSLDEIANVIKYDLNNLNDLNFKNSLEIQKKILDEKLIHMHTVINAIDEALNMVNNNKELNWGKFIKIINVINEDKKWLEQYHNASNLKARINIHDMFSTNKQGWMKWFFTQLDIPENSRILELGCGDASLWVKNYKLIPEGWDITLTDFSEGMLKDAKRNLGSRAKRFEFKLADAQEIPFNDESFDVVIANHMLYHVADIEAVFSEIHRVLKYEGYFFASTIGKNHMKELREIIMKFASEGITSESFNETQKFHLENGLKQISNWFDDVKLKRYKDSLIVTESEPLVDYIFSMPGNTKGIFDTQKLSQLLNFLNNKIRKDGGIYITKDTGFFESRKNNK